MRPVEVWFRGRWRFADVIQDLDNGWRRVRVKKDGRVIDVAPYEVRFVKFVVKG